MSTRHRLYIIGASGTGKTTLAKALAEKLKLPHFDSDNYYKQIALVIKNAALIKA